MPAARTHGTLGVLVVAGSPEPSSAATVGRLADASDYVIAADAGIGACRRAGVVPDAWVGDADSAASDDGAWVAAQHATIVSYPREKDATDLALAVRAARNEAARRDRALRLTLTCASGGRPDHALGVLGVAARAADVAARIVEDGFECRMLSPTGADAWSLGERDVGRTLSVVPLGGDAIVSEHGTHWELDRARLRPLDDRGISNVIVAEHASVTCHAGTLACFVLTDGATR